MATIGKVNEVRKETDFEWRIENFFSLSAEDGKFYDSPSFSFADASWIIRIYPNGDPKDDTVGYLGVFLFLFKGNSGLPFEVLGSFGFKNFGRKIFQRINWRQTFFADNEMFGDARFVSRAEVSDRKSELAPDDVLTVFFTFNWLKSTANFRLEKLSNDFERLMERGDRSDTKVKVKGEEFLLHRNILAARSPFFDSMFKSGMKEDITGIVSIDDCEPDTFRSFIHFVYTGKVEGLSAENVCDLYEVADRYQEDQLKAECLRLMLNSISVDNICEFVVMALRYDEKVLFEKATEFFASNTKKIQCSLKWKLFLRDHPVSANKIYSKTLETFVNKRLIEVSITNKVPSDTSLSGHISIE